MIVCSQCVMPETFPGISFDSQGVCRFCRSYQSRAHGAEEKAKYRKKFEELLDRHRGRNRWDCLMAYSGGKDSTYTMALLKERFGLSVLALTFDNGFISPFAWNNIRNVTENLGIDAIIFKPRFDLLRMLFRECSRNPVFAPKTLERASTICTACMGLVKSTLLKTALEKGIPFIIYGWSPGQAPINAAVFKNNPVMAQSMQRAIQEPLRKIAGRDIDRYFLHDDDFTQGDRFPFNVSPLAFLDYNEDAIVEAIGAFGWKAPEDTDSNSTNCLLNSYANVIHKTLFRFHPYTLELAGLVREGCMSRSEALSKLEAEENPETVRRVREKLQES